MVRIKLICGTAKLKVGDNLFDVNYDIHVVSYLKNYLNGKAVRFFDR